MPSIRLILAPYHLGKAGEGVANGPLRLLELGADAALGSSGAAITAERVDFVATGTGGEPAALVGSVAAIARQVATATRAGELPVVLAGNCFASVGVLAGLGDRELGVAWLDAHGDFNTPETTVTGFLDGMSLAVAVGDCWQALVASVPGFRPIPAERVLLAGTRDLDPAERARLERSPVTHVPAEDLLAGPLPMLDGQGVDVQGVDVQAVHVHLDLDVLHDSLGPVNGYGLTEGGIPPRRLSELVDDLAGRVELRSLALTAYDPDVASGAVAQAALDVLGVVGRCAT